MKSKGLLHVYYGNGKGKTTAALGLALRAYGQGFRVVILQFLKGTFSGELAVFEKLPGIKIMRGPSDDRFVSAMTHDEKKAIRHIYNAFLGEIDALIKEGACDFLVLDEALDACQLSMADEVLLSDILNNKLNETEVVITGHRPVAWIMDRADYVTEMVKHKHPYDQGIGARKGVEY